MFGIALQVVLALPPCHGPVRLGVPLPAAVAQRGLRLRGAGRLQWRPLPLRPRDELRWYELAWEGTEGPVRVVLGGTRPAAVYECEQEIDGKLHVCTTTWRWRSGAVDVRRRRQFHAAAEVGDEWFAVGESLTAENAALAQRWLCCAELREPWQRQGLLPRGRPDPRMLAHLVAAAHALVELPGQRGRGDYARSGAVVTNLEFDTTLALLRLGLASGERSLLRKARESAWHLIDRDLDHATGLPFAHGEHHRSGRPQPGHVWLTGLLWVGALTADRLLLEAAQQIARALAERTVPAGERDLARDSGWPLLELEAYLELVDDPLVAGAADRLARAIARRYEPALRTFRFGEGEVGKAVYFERGWITGGIVLPALRRHLARRPDPELQRVVDEATRGLVDAAGTAGCGIATHWRCAGGRSFAHHFVRGDPKLFLMLEGVPLLDLRRLLSRRKILPAMQQVPALDDPDLATNLTMIARCRWIYRLRSS